MTGKVLLIEDDDALRLSLAQTIELGGYEPVPMASFVQARRSIRANFSGVVLTDIRMPRQDGFDVLQFAQNVDADLPVILLTGHSDVPTAMRAMKEGAYDYLEKPCGTDELMESLGRAMNHRALVLKSRQIERALLRGDMAAINFPGSTGAVETLRAAMRDIAASGRHAHLYGAAGTGKKLAAYTIHRLAEQPRHLLQVNLRTAPPDVLRELPVPDGPTDLVCKFVDMATPHQQLHLLELLHRHDGLRLLSTSLNPLSEIRPHAVVEDVTLAEGMVEVRLPTLDERREDLPEIFESFVRQAIRNLDIDMPEIPQSVIAEIMTRAWDGDLPELRRHAMSFALGRKAQTDAGGGQSLAEQMDAFERLVLTETLRRTGGSASLAATSLGLPRNTFYDRLARHGLSPKDFRTWSDPAADSG